MHNGPTPCIVPYTDFGRNRRSRKRGRVNFCHHVNRCASPEDQSGIHRAYAARPLGHSARRTQLGLRAETRRLPGAGHQIVRRSAPPVSEQQKLRRQISGDRTGPRARSRIPKSLSMASQHIAFDGSGKADCEHVVFAGLLSLPDRWVSMSQQWNATLQNEGLTFWRTSNAAHLTGQFKQFRSRPKDLDKLSLELARIACEFGTAGYVASVTMEDYKRLEEAQRKILRDPFYAAFQSGIKSSWITQTSCQQASSRSYATIRKNTLASA